MRHVLSVRPSNMISEREYALLRSAFLVYADKFMATADKGFQLVYLHNGESDKARIGSFIEHAAASVLPGTRFAALCIANYYGENKGHVNHASTIRYDSDYRNGITSLEAGVEFTDWSFSRFGVARPTVQPVLKVSKFGDGRETFDGLPMSADHAFRNQYGPLPVRYNIIPRSELSLEHMAAAASRRLSQ